MSDPSSSAGASAPDAPPRVDSSRVDRGALDAAVARYRRAERVVSWTLALLVAGAFLAAVAALSLWPGVAVATVLVVALRLPAFRRRGSTRLRTDAPPETVVREFASSTPPVLAFQWGVADEVRGPDGEATALGDDDSDERPSGTTATYALSYLFGLRTAELSLDVDATDGDRPSKGAPDRDDESDRPAAASVEIEATTDGRPWASYAVGVSEAADGGSIVDVELRPTRRFDLRRIPQGRAAERHYADALAAQGYEVVQRTTSLTR
ncbi:hypothetical protein [Halorubrum sp. 2020YC2]|uniref:hypothetical protein n=1 Tax=Halorubrum sp. 2020YC2 TaxID=2836432 RepID=UPI002036B0AF|nr:hypothetical protein [Halorubrum sp. 2020YC2]